MSKPIQIILRKHSADGPYVGRLPDGLMPEILATLSDFQDTLEEMTALDTAHGGGFAEAIQGRLARLEKLIEKLGG
jgi:hypothetical protein